MSASSQKHLHLDAIALIKSEIAMGFGINGISYAFDQIHLTTPMVAYFLSIHCFCGI